MYKQYSPKIPNHSLSVTNLGKSRLVYYFQNGSFPWLKVFSVQLTYSSRTRVFAQLNIYLGGQQIFRQRSKDFLGEG